MHHNKNIHGYIHINILVDYYSNSLHVSVSANHGDCTLSYRGGLRCQAPLEG